MASSLWAQSSWQRRRMVAKSSRLSASMRSVFPLDLGCEGLVVLDVVLHELLGTPCARPRAPAASQRPPSGRLSFRGQSAGSRSPLQGFLAAAPPRQEPRQRPPPRPQHGPQAPPRRDSQGAAPRPRYQKIDRRGPERFVLRPQHHPRPATPGGLGVTRHLYLIWPPSPWWREVPVRGARRGVQARLPREGAGAGRAASRVGLGPRARGRSGSIAFEHSAA